MVIEWTGVGVDVGVLLVGAVDRDGGPGVEEVSEEDEEEGGREVT